MKVVSRDAEPADNVGQRALVASTLKPVPIGEKA
jgi:hypothetical protein